MKKKLMCISAVITVLITASGCENAEKNKESIAAENSQNRNEESFIIEENNEDSNTENRKTDSNAEVINPLTGEEGFDAEAVGKRPVAVMVNNIKASLPQYGITQADVIYEVPVEGGITRLMAVYADFRKVPDVCSVRSCRYYYPILCLGMDAIYVHWGEDKTIALETLNRTGIDHIDGEFDKGLFYRDSERAKNMATEHTGYIKGDELAGKIADKGFRTDIDEKYSGTLFNFADGGEVVPDELSGDIVTVNFSGEYFSTFEFNSEIGKYKKLHSGSPQIDGRTNTQLEFENIFVLQTDVHTREDGYLMDVALSGGTGYYFSNGGGQVINWTKKDEKDAIKIYNADGVELTVNTGKSYIGIIGSEKNIDF